MKTRVEQTMELHSKGYNCAQSVACAYCDLVGVDEDTMFKMMEGFGLGMGGMQGTCGAISGAAALIGMKNSNGCSDTTSKSKTYKIAKQALNKFMEKNGSVTCSELKGVGTGKVLRSCDGCIQDAAEIIEDLLSE